MSSLYSIILFFRALGFRKLFSILRSTIRKISSDYSYKPDRLSQSISPGEWIDFKISGEEFHFTYSNAKLEIIFLQPSLIQVSWRPGEPQPYSCKVLKKLQPVTCQVQEFADGWKLSTESLTVQVNKDGSIRYFDSESQLLRSELPPTYQSEEMRNPHQTNIHWTNKADIKLSKFFIGFGMHTGGMDLRGKTFRIWNNDPGGTYATNTDPIYMPLPLYLSIQATGSYLIVFDNSSEAEGFFPEPYTDDPATIRFTRGAMTYYLITGPLEEIYNQLGNLIGFPAMPPLWSLGYHQSRWGYKNQETIQRLAANFIEQNLPVSAIHLDIDYMDKFRVFTVDPCQFPSLVTLSNQLHEKEIRLITILDPGVKKDKDYSLFQEGISKDIFVNLDNKPYVGAVWPGDAVFPDFTNSEARDWWGAAYQILLDEGVDGFWHDMNEPTSFTIIGDKAMPLKSNHHFDGASMDHRLAHNLYGKLMNQSAYENLRKLSPEKRPWILSRSGWIGNNQYAWNWTGDVESSWNGLQQTIRILISLGLSGIPFTGSDIGGFSGNPSPELYVRWLQMSTFCAFMRTHSAIGTQPREPWIFSEPYATMLRKFLELRYQFLPYLYTQAWLVTQTGAPFIRPVFWNAPEQSNLWTIEDEFLLGDEILIAPVCEEGAPSRLVTLPPGGWFDFWDSQFHAGNQVIQYPTPLHRIPIFIRSNSVIPLQEGDKFVLHLFINELELGDKLSLAGKVYSDIGDGYGDYRLDRYNLSKNLDRIELHKKYEGNYRPSQENIGLQFHGTSPQTISVDNCVIPVADKTYLDPDFSLVSWNENE